MSNYLRRMAVVAALLGTGSAWSAANVAIDNILISKVSGVTTVQIWPACQMQYINHSPKQAGRELRIRVSTSPACYDLFGEVAAERYSQSSLRLGNVTEVLFDSLNARDTYITLRFAEPQQFLVRQHAVGWIEVDVDTTVDSATLPPNMPDPLKPEILPEPSSSSLLADRPPPQHAPEPSARVNPPPSTKGGFVVQLGVFERVEPTVAALRQTSAGHFAYATEFEVNEKTWHGVQLGFFDSEAQAEGVLAEVAGRFPDAWVRFVSDNESATARAAGDLRIEEQSEFKAVRAQTDTAGDASTISALFTTGRQALLERRYDDAVQSYTQVLRTRDHDRQAEAREMLGVALERSGRTEFAIAEYQAFLSDYPQHEGSRRVRQRLDGLTLLEVERAFDDTEAAPTRAEGLTEGWQITGSVSHYYWRNQEQVVHDGNYLVSSTGVLGLGDLTLRRRGERFDVLAHYNGAYQHNLIEDDPVGDIGWVSDAFVDVVDHEWGLQGRLGRQTSRRDGVQDRFDGIALSYRWRPDLTFGVSTGYPIDSPRFSTDTRRFFYAASARMNGLLKDRLTATVYTHQQTVDSIADRQAVGGELLYHDGPLSVVGLVDFDLSYEVLNMAHVNASWLMGNGWTISARGDVGAVPFLTTQNALAGQLVTSIDALGAFYSEGQIRRLARNRTAQMVSGSAGLSIPLGERFDVSLDVTMRQLEATDASGGVAAIPDSGSQVFFNATMVGTNILRENDLVLMSVRHDSTRTRDVSSFILDARLPFGRAFRMSPRVAVDYRVLTNGSSEQLIVTPSLRLLYRRGNMLFDLEAGGRWSNRDLTPGELDPFTPDGIEELLGGFVNLGYRWEF